MKHNDKIIYAICVKDVQNVAEEHLGRELIDKEVSFVEDRIGDYIDWYGAISSVLNDLNHKKLK